MRRVRVLLVEDNPSDVLLMKRTLMKKWENLEFASVDNEESFRQKLQEQSWDLIVSDYSLPQFSGLTALKILAAEKLDIPFIMVSGKMGEEVAVEVMRAGAQDYIIKDKMERVVPAIERELKEWETRRQNVEALEALRKSEIAWSKTFSAIGDSILLIDENGIVKQCNRAAEKLFSRSALQLFGLSCNELFEKAEVKKEICPFNVTKNTHKREKSEFRWQGRWFELTVDPIIDYGTRFMGAVHITKDITERKRNALLQEVLYKISTAVHKSGNLEQLFSNIREYLSAVIDTRNIFAALLDHETDELYMSFEISEIDHAIRIPRYKTLTNYVLKQDKAMLFTEADMLELVDKGEIELVGPPALIWLGAPLRTGGKAMGVLALQSFDNPRQFTEKDLTLLEIVSNEIAHAIERKQYEENLSQANAELRAMHHDLEIKVEKAVAELREKDHIIMEQSRQAAVGNMISQIAHHWRQPLNTIGLTIQSLGDAYEFGELTAEYLNQKTSSAMQILQELSKSIDDFRFLYQRDDGLESFDIKLFLQKLCGLLNEKYKDRKIEFEVDLAESHMIKGYANHFSQAVLNVLTNAYDVITSRQIPDPHIWLKYYLENDLAHISIRDNAGGIADEMKDKLFDLYSTTKKGLNNTGIGLYMTKLIIETNMGGKVKVIDHPDGAEFIIIV